MSHQRSGRHLVLGDIRIHYIKIGSGRPPLIVLPGITSPAASWEFVAQRLETHADVYIMDIRGRGLSSGGSHLSYRLDDYSADLNGMIESLGLENPALLGHSMGARIAIRYAARYQTPLRRLILVDPPVSGPGRRPYPIGLSYYLDSIEEVRRGLGYEALKANFGWTAEQIDNRMEWLPTCDPYAISETHRSFHDESIHEDLPRIAATSHLLYAERGNTVSDEDAAEITSAMPHCTAHKVLNAGHMIPWDQLDVFVEAVTGFLQPASA
jgi:N-formylmaleamate deformylase